MNSSVLNCVATSGHIYFKIYTQFTSQSAWSLIDRWLDHNGYMMHIDMMVDITESGGLYEGSIQGEAGGFQILCDKSIKIHIYFMIHVRLRYFNCNIANFHVFLWVTK